jgi:hypothetical protein
MAVIGDVQHLLATTYSKLSDTTVPRDFTTIPVLKGAFLRISGIARKAFIGEIVYRRWVGGVAGSGVKGGDFVEKTRVVVVG